MRDAHIKCPEQDFLLFIQWFFQPKILPQPQGYPGEKYPASSAPRLYSMASYLFSAALYIMYTSCLRDSSEFVILSDPRSVPIRDPYIKPKKICHAAPNPFSELRDARSPYPLSAPVPSTLPNPVTDDQIRLGVTGSSTFVNQYQFISAVIINQPGRRIHNQ